MTGHLEVYPRRDGRWAWRLTADNGRIIATDGGQGYERPGAAHAIATRILAGEFTTANVTATTHPDPTGDADMSDTTTTKYAVARRGKVISGLFSDPDSATSELDAIKGVAAGIGIADSLRVVEVDVDVVTTISEPRDYTPPAPGAETVESDEDSEGDADSGDA